MHIIRRPSFDKIEFLLINVRSGRTFFRKTREAEDRFVTWLLTTQCVPACLSSVTWRKWTRGPDLADPGTVAVAAGRLDVMKMLTDCLCGRPLRGRVQECGPEGATGERGCALKKAGSCFGLETLSAVRVY